MRTARLAAFAVVPLLSFALSACSLDAKSTSADTSGTAQTPLRKPPRGRVEAGTAKILKESGGFESLDLSDDQYRKMGACVTKRLYDQATAFTLNGLASGKQDFQIAVKDRQILEKAAAECASQASAQIANPDSGTGPSKDAEPNEGADSGNSSDPDKDADPSSAGSPSQSSDPSRQ